MRYWRASMAVPGQLSCLLARPRACTSDPRGTPALPHPVYGQTPSARRGTAGQLCIVVNNDAHGHTVWDKQEVCQYGGGGSGGGDGSDWKCNWLECNHQTTDSVDEECDNGTAYKHRVAQQRPAEILKVEATDGTDVHSGHAADMWRTCGGHVADRSLPVCDAMGTPRRPLRRCRCCPAPVALPCCRHRRTSS